MLRTQQSHPPDIAEMQNASAAAKTLLAQWSQLEIHNDLLYRRWLTSKGELLQLIIPRLCRNDFLERVHGGMTRGHFGVRRTVDQVQRRAYWPGWRKNIRGFCRRCVACSSYHRGQLPRTGQLQPMLSGAPFEKLHFDLTGPHPRSRRGSVYIVTCIDAFSKWAEAFLSPNKEAATVARILVEQVICRFGAPIAGISDRGGEVDGQVMREVCRLLDIDKLRTTAYKPSTNGVVERFHATLNALIGRVIDDSQRDWDTLLPYVMAAYRASRHESTGFTPNALNLGREVRAPVDLVFGTPETPLRASYQSYVDELHDKMQYAYATVREQLNVVAEREKRRYDLRAKPHRFRVGDWVYYFKPRKLVGRQDKWRRKFSGSFLIIKVVGPVNVVLQRSRRARPFCVHIDKVKPYESAENVPKSWLLDTDGKNTEPRPDGDPIRNMERDVDISQNLTVAPDGDRVLDESATSPGFANLDAAIAGAPTLARTPRPRRHAGRPARYRD